MYHSFWPFLLCLVIFSSCASEYAYKRNEYWHKKPLKTGSYQIQEQGHTIGYAHRYAWETKGGNDHEYYLIADRTGSLVGYLAADGTAEKYLADGSTQVLGNFTLDSAAARIFETEHTVQIYSAQLQDVPETVEPAMPVRDSQKKPIVTATQKKENDKSVTPQTEKSNEEKMTPSFGRETEEEGMSKE